MSPARCCRPARRTGPSAVQCSAVQCSARQRGIWGGTAGRVGAGRVGAGRGGAKVCKGEGGQAGVCVSEGTGRVRWEKKGHRVVAWPEIGFGHAGSACRHAASIVHERVCRRRRRALQCAQSPTSNQMNAACCMLLTLCARVSAMTRLECVRGLVVVLVRPCLPCRDDHADALLLKWECLVGDVPKWE